MELLKKVYHIVRAYIALPIILVLMVYALESATNLNNLKLFGVLALVIMLDPPNVKKFFVTFLTGCIFIIVCRPFFLGGIHIGTINFDWFQHQSATCMAVFWICNSFFERNLTFKKRPKREPKK